MSRSKSKTEILADQPQSLEFRHLAPQGQPKCVHEVSDALYKSFEGSNVRLRLSGCSINHVPFVQSESGQYFLLSGEAVSESHAESLGLCELEELTQTPPEWNSLANRNAWAAQIESLSLKTKLNQAIDDKQWIVWCNHIQGTLTAQAGSSSVDVPFSLWANRLKNESDKCPPYHCPLTGIDSYNLDVDDEGTISDAASIVLCPETGRRLLSVKTDGCQVTGHRVSKEVLGKCPVRNQWVTSKLLEQCSSCFQSVTPQAIVKGRCESCRQLTKPTGSEGWSQLTTKIELRNVDWLANARKLKATAQDDSWVVQAVIDGIAWIMVIDNESGEILSAARSRGWLRGWSLVEENDWPC